MSTVFCSIESDETNVVGFRYPALDRCAIKAIFGEVVLICTSHQKPSYKFNTKVAAISIELSIRSRL
jgi:hypothetical protein